MKKMSPLLIFGLCFILLVGVYGGLLVFKKSAANSKIETLQAAKLELQNQLTVYQEKNLEQAVAAQNMLSILDAGKVKWSQVIKEIRNTLPKIANGDYAADVLSYSGTSDNKISMNMQTIPNTEGPYYTVASVIQAFDESKNFKDSFVASIGSALNPFGQQILTFSLTTQYQPESTVYNNSSDKKPISR